MIAVLAVVALGVGLCALGWWRSAHRVGELEARVRDLEREIHDSLAPMLERARRESEEAFAAARAARHAAGIEDPPPRLAAEPVTGPVVRAIAFGAGARRAIGRFAAGVIPLARARRPARAGSAAARGTAAPRRRSAW